MKLPKCRMTVFAWSLEDVTDVDSILVIHKLSVDELIKLVQQNKRKFALERQQMI